VARLRSRFFRQAKAFLSVPRKRNSPAFRIGQNVTHSKFGTGVIIDAEGARHRNESRMVNHAMRCGR
jgi:hypothetical protein